MTEVCFCGGGHRTRLKQFNLCVFGCPPAPVYKGEREEGPANLYGAAREGTPTRNRIAILFLVGFTERKKGERIRRGGAPPPPILVQLGFLGGGAGQPYGLPLSHPLGPHWTIPSLRG